MGMTMNLSTEAWGKCFGISKSTSAAICPNPFRFSNSTEQTISIVGADGDEIVVWCRIVVLWDAVWFAFRMVHVITPVRIRRNVLVSEAGTAERS